MKELSRFEIAAIKRIAQNVKSSRVKKAKLEKKIAELQGELDIVNATIDSFEEPVKKMTGGYTSEEVLNGTMNAETEIAEEAQEAKEAVESEENKPETFESQEFGSNMNDLPFNE